MEVGQKVMVLTFAMHLPSLLLPMMLSQQNGFCLQLLVLVWLAVRVFMDMYLLSNGHLVCLVDLLSISTESSLAVVWCG